MADQVETPKVVGYSITGPTANDASATKVVAYMILVPGEIAAGDTTRQGHVHAQILRRS
jgi:hypothetical protein